MVSGKYRSRTFRRVYVKTPGGDVRIHYKKRKPSKPQCAKCGTELKGVIAARQLDMKRFPKTYKRPERMFGGYYCSSCSRQKIKEMARK